MARKSFGQQRLGIREMGRWGDGEMGEWGDGGIQLKPQHPKTLKP
ncbi:hypothetical protein [Microcystis sp. BLCC-F210]